MIPLHEQRDRLDWEENQRRESVSVNLYRLALLVAVLAVLVTLGRWARGEDALDVVNRQRASRGLFPFQRDDGLSIAAEKCAQYRAARGIEGHVNDFAFVPRGSHATCAGCAAWESGFGACELYSTHYRYAGAAWVRRGGRNYCHCFYR